MDTYKNYTDHSCSITSESYCPHYGRDTCLIRFKCCTEEDWYPCHKCHNEAVAKLAEERASEREESKPLPARPETNDVPQETVDYMEAGESWTEILGEPQDLQEGTLTLGETEDASSNEPVNEITGTEESEENNENINEEKCTGIADSQSAENLTPKLEHTETAHPMATALDGTELKCIDCQCTQKTFSKSCSSCGKPFADYFCSKCQLLIEYQVDPYHCDDCKTCRENEKDHFHCHTCNVCMALALKDNHKCFPDRGHDPCAICLEEVFSGAIIFPCFHMIHKNCAMKLLVFGSVTCPMCRNPICQDKQDNKDVITATSIRQWLISRLPFWLGYHRGNNTALPAPLDTERNEDRGGYFQWIGMGCFGRFGQSAQSSSVNYSEEETSEHSEMDFNEP